MAQTITPVMTAFIPVKYSLKLVELLYNDTIYPQITNTKYEGQIKDSGDRVRVRTIGRITLSAYSKGLTLVPQELTPTYEDLVIDKLYYFLFGVDDVDKIQNDINAIEEYASTTKNDIAELIDTDVLAYMAKNVSSANMLGTAYATGTVAIAATTGVVTGSGTTFTSGHVGGIFTTPSLTEIINGVSVAKSFLVTAYSSTTSITIKDLDGVAYTGGAVSAGETFSIAGAVALSTSKSTVYQRLVDMSTALNKSLAPRNDRFVVVNAAFEGVLRQAPEFIPAVESSYSGVVKKGVIGEIAGFKVISSELVAGNNTTGYWYVAGTKDYCAFALQIMKTVVIPADTVNDSFVTMCKGLVVWGRKVFQGNRARGVVLRTTIA
jgi:hypothetical protein